MSDGGPTSSSIPSMPVGIGTVDRDGVTTYVNEHLAQLLGRAADEMLGRPLLEQFHPTDHQVVLEHVHRRRDGISDQYDVRMLKADGGSVHVRVSGGPLLHDGRFVGSIAAITDIHDLTVSAAAQRLAILDACEHMNSLVQDLLDSTADPATGTTESGLVLYVEDEPLNASLVESIIGLLPGRRLHVEPTVAGGIEAAHRLHPALVLLDLNLPDGSGFDVLRSIREEPTMATVPVFMLSADATEQATTQARELGADRFITKPFNLKEFVALVESVT